MEKRIDKLIDKSHLRSNKEVVAYVKERLPNADERLIKQRNKRKKALRGKQRPKEITAHYWYPVFSNHTGGYQVDLLQKSKLPDKADKTDDDDTNTGANERQRDYPPFFFIAINTNTKYGYAYKMENKTEAEILRCLKLFWEDAKHNVVSIRCDEEAGLDSRAVNDWFEENKISVKSIRDQNHTSLSVVDRFIRTLRDMNTPTEKTERTSMNRKYRDFTEKRMKKLVEIYNDTVHKTTGKKPKDMDDEAEREYIIKKLYESERRHKLKDYNLAKKTYVKYILPRDGKKKHRYKVSPECYKIMGKDGHAYIIAARDGSTLILTRWRLIPLGRTLPKGMKLAQSVNDAKNGIIKKITNYNKEDDTYSVLWKNPKKERIITREPVANFKRDRKQPTILTRHEEAFWEGKRIPAGIL
jgi:hypothetical protein